MSAATVDTGTVFARRLERLAAAQPFAKSLYQNEVLQAAGDVLACPDGLETLYPFADRLQRAGVFADSPWHDPSKLQPHLVLGTLKSGGGYAVMEVLSELRMLAIAQGVYEDSAITRAAAEEFLNQALALNLGLVFSETEDSGDDHAEEVAQAKRLLRFLAERLDERALLSCLVRHVQRLAVQRPITVNRITSILNHAGKMAGVKIEGKERAILTGYIDAINGPTALSRKHPRLEDYRKEIKTAADPTLQKEAKAFARSMRHTGLVSRHHAVFVRCVVGSRPDLCALSLGLSKKGQANFEEEQDLVQQLIKVAVHPATCHVLYGLARVLDKGVLSFPPVVPGLRRLIELDVRKEVAKALTSSRQEYQGLSENSILVAGVLSVLGQPLGIGQGLNPTCQSARGISLWAQHAAGYLLELIPRAARDGDVELRFEGETLHSSTLRGGLISDFEKMDLDPVSVILVPHLDRLYNEMMRRAAHRDEDPHKWVNPALYGNWIYRGFRSAVDATTGVVADYGGFIRLFYATHHPEFNDGRSLIYPNPVGIFITNVHGKLLGLHAISIQRVSADPHGVQRVYFYNPNDNSSQNWGQGITPSVLHHGEEEGESSLPIDQFTARLYAFHYNPYEQGDAYAVPEAAVGRIAGLARESWGRSYVWER